MPTVFAAALLPVLLLLGFILCKDKNSPEPPALLLKAFGLGVLSVIPALVLVGMFAGLGLGAGEGATVWSAVGKAFWGAAIPEEIAKLGMLWLVLRKNPFFDEKMDGIVYAVCVSLGFAATENVFYLISADNFVQTSISRALFAVPGHFCDGVLMGYYYSLARFGSSSPRRHHACVLAAPIQAHGVYDALLFAIGVVEPFTTFVLLILFIVFCFQLWKYAARRITEHLLADGVLRG